MPKILKSWNLDLSDNPDIRNGFLWLSPNFLQKFIIRFPKFGKKAIYGRGERKIIFFYLLLINALQSISLILIQSYQQTDAIVNIIHHILVVAVITQSLSIVVVVRCRRIGLERQNTKILLFANFSKILQNSCRMNSLQKSLGSTVNLMQNQFTFFILKYNCWFTRSLNLSYIHITILLHRLIFVLWSWNTIMKHHTRLWHQEWSR